MLELYSQERIFDQFGLWIMFVLVPHVHRIKFSIYIWRYYFHFAFSSGLSTHNSSCILSFTGPAPGQNKEAMPAIYSKYCLLYFVRICRSPPDFPMGRGKMKIGVNRIVSACMHFRLGHIYILRITTKLKTPKFVEGKWGSRLSPSHIRPNVRSFVF